MSTITPTVSDVLGDRGSVLSFTWATMANNDTGSPMKHPKHADVTIHILGTFDSSTVVWQGSNDGSNWVTLTDPQGNSISKTAAAIETVSECPLYCRPSVTGGASTSITVIALARRNGA